MILTRYRFALAAVAIVALSACTSAVQATPSPWVVPSGEPTPTPAVSSSNGITRVVIHLSPNQGEGQIGTAVLISDGRTTTIEINVAPITGESQPIHIHVGTCDDVGSVVHSLQNVVNGNSLTTIDRSLDDILASDLLVNVHASYAEPSNYTACGLLPGTS